VLHVRDAQDPEDYARRAEAWTRSVWEAWGAHHATVAAWFESEVGDAKPSTRDQRGHSARA
jgi:hypothetical protein